MEYQEHGAFSVKVENKLLLIDGTGPFNEELVARYNAAIEPCIAQLENTRWNQIVTLHKMSIFTPDAEEDLTQSIIYRKSRGLVACAVIIEEESARGITEQQMSRCYNKAGVINQYFNNLDQAKYWLASLN